MFSNTKKHVHKISQHLQIKAITEFFLSTVDLFISVLHIDFLCKWKNLRQEMWCDSGDKRRPNSFYVLVVWYNSYTSDFLCWQPFTFFQCLLVYYNMSKEKKTNQGRNIRVITYATNSKVTWTKRK